VALVLLRLAVGWHFYREGTAKLQPSSKFTSTAFLSNAKGPFAPLYHNMIWDADGQYRLSLEDTRDAWQAFRDQAAEQYGFDNQQEKEAQAVYQRYERQMAWYLGSQASDIDEYLKGLERRDRYRGQDPEQSSSEVVKNRPWTEVPSLRGQLASIEDELQKKRNGWLRTIDKLWADYEQAINDLATEDQRRYGPVSLPRLGRRAFDSVTVDGIIPYFDLTIGVLLILGLFTRLASCAGAAFLASVVVSQWPWAPGAADTYYQTVELCALLVLAGTAAGRFAGLDFFLYAARLKCCPPKQES
jgi:uncharacterized membrane protein YphA (DoxX/SURF4 family)